MPQKLDELIIKVLNIIGYTNDKQKFASEFINSCRKQAFLELINTLSPEEQEALNQQIKGGEGSKIASLLNEQFNSDKYNQALRKVIEDSFKEYVASIKPHLSKTQLQNLQLFFSRSAVTTQQSL